MALAAQHDPDTGRRRVLQCECGASRRNTTPRDALNIGWRRTWLLSGSTRWHCPGCCTGHPGIDKSPHVGPPSIEVLNAAVGGNAAYRRDIIHYFDHLIRHDPERAWVWLAFIVKWLQRLAALRAWAEYLHLRNLWSDPLLAQHSSASNEHYTPPDLCDLVRQVFGCEIDLDPASCALANQLVRALRYYTKEDNGLVLPWSGSVFVNAPGEAILVAGEKGRVSQAAFWWAHLATRYAKGAITQAAFVCFNLELLRHTQAWPVSQPLDHAICIFKHRIAYWEYRDGILVPAEQPTHPSALVYLGPHAKRFREVFTQCEDAFAGYVYSAAA